MNLNLKQLAKEDKRAQGHFYDAFSSLVMGICIRYMKDRDRAADVFQDTFIKLFTRVGQVRSEAELPGWVRRVTINTALDHLRSIRFDPISDAADMELSDQFYSDLLDRLSNEVILDAINKLPAGYRVIFNMYVLDGYTHQEIATHLSISEATSRSQLTHARKTLKRYLNELGITRYEQVI